MIALSKIIEVIFKINGPLWCVAVFWARVFYCTINLPEKMYLLGTWLLSIARQKKTYQGLKSVRLVIIV
jgi:hypothetical protein